MNYIDIDLLDSPEVADLLASKKARQQALHGLDGLA